MTDDHRPTERIRELNDAFRSVGPTDNPLGRWCLTPGVSALGVAAVLKAIELARTYADFSPDNDPYGEHDFGDFQLDGHKIYWKIDYYDAALEFGSENPADEALTTRVLTILLASEY